MSTYTQIIYQIVFSTKNRERTLSKNNRELLFKYISGLLNNKKCHLYVIGGVEDHIHILTHIHPCVSLSALVKDIKISTCGYIKEARLFQKFNGWQEGYGAFTYSIKEKQIIIDYILNQEQHHSKKSFKNEYFDLLTENDVLFEEKYLL